MITEHIIQKGDSRELSKSNKSIDLVITSPPYPMINIWDETFYRMNPEIKNALIEENGMKAFELMHMELDKVWYNIYNLMKDGGIVCINIGDATRKVGRNFQIYPNHARIIQSMTSIGFQALPWIIWRKPTNSPTKFMGSGMLPPSAYVTLEHEFILIFRKNGKRVFSDSERLLRRKSAFFWEERNLWFSDVWFDILGTSQKLAPEIHIRNRSAAFPLEIAYRLIQMFSIYEDTVFDPFLGTGTTTIASAISGRNSIGIELEQELIDNIPKRLFEDIKLGREIIAKRLEKHTEFIQNNDKTPKYFNKHLNTPVITKQETDIVFYEPIKITAENNKFTIIYQQYLA